jgi:dTDP-4-dehydrorhamnose 3,5-epimerase
MHFSVAPHAETKIVRCTSGAICDVLIDVRIGSPTYLTSISIVLSAENRHAVYIPAGIAHGFQTLRDDTEVLYMIDVPYASESARGLRWNDPAIQVEWPEPISIISPRDLAYLDWVRPGQKS